MECIKKNGNHSTSLLFPVHLNLSGRPVLVVGGGRVALRRVKSLLEAGATVTVVAPRVNEALRSLAAGGGITLHLRRFRQGDTAPFFLCIAATDDPAVNREVVEDARRFRVLVTSADDPAGGDFVVPAVHRDGELVVSVGCGGVPLLAAALRDRIAHSLGKGWRERVERVKRFRRKLLTRSRGDAYNKKILRRICSLLAVSGGDEGASPPAAAPRRNTPPSTSPDEPIESSGEDQWT